MNLRLLLRNLCKRPFLNIVKVTGLSLALSCLLLIVLFLKNEITYDRFGSNSDRIYRFTVTSGSFLEGRHFARVINSWTIPVMAGYFPQVESYVRLAPVRGGVMKYNNMFIETSQSFICDSTFFELFGNNLLAGNPGKVLDAPRSMVVSESFARKVFGDANPMGEVLTLPSGQYYGENTDFTVSGIMKDFPANSHLHPEFIVTPPEKSYLESWSWVYLLLAENTDPSEIEKGYQDFYTTHIDSNSGDSDVTAYLQKITDIHLHSYKLREIEQNRSMSVIYTFTIAALVLLLIALANYANLNIGMAGFSDKYLFVSKVFGSSPGNTVRYFLSEGAIIAFISLTISILIALPVNDIIRRNYGIDLMPGNTAVIIIVLLIFTLMVIFAGAIPLSKHFLHTIRPLPGKEGILVKRKGISKSIIVLQYTISIALIIGVIVIKRQTDFALGKSMGVDNENLICFENVPVNVQNKFTLFKDELLKYNSISSVSAMLEPPGGEANDMMKFTMEDFRPDMSNEDNYRIGVFPCDYSFPSVFNLTFLSGNDFSPTNEDAEGFGEYIINRAALKRLCYSNPEDIIGKTFDIEFNSGPITIPSGKIIGVIEDFHLSGVKKKVEPLVFFKRKDLWLMNLIVELNPGSESRALDDIKTTWQQFFPENPFRYEYVSAMNEKLYRSELLEVTLLSLFTIIALFICSMGLLGMSLLTAQRRTREIGIRKINGASTGMILKMLNRDLLKWLVISFALAIPLAAVIMNKWLEPFAYRISLQWWIFAMAGFITLTIAVITVTLQSWKAAGSNPVEALRYE